MKISLNWLKEYVSVPESVSDEELIRLIGARLVEVEGVIDERRKYDGIVVVRVEKAEKIPDTHLTLCQVNDGGSELIQVVCGAPNVREGMLAAWIKPGATVPASVNEDAPFVLGKRKMMGLYDSNGMLAAEDELDLGSDHEGIIEINPEMAKPGDLFAEVFELNDLILEIENKSLTHRPDCFGIIGFAREVAGILGVGFSEPDFFSAGLEFSSTSYAGTPAEPSLRDEPVGSVRNIGVENSNHGMLRKNQVSENSNIKITITDPEICPRYTCAEIKVAQAVVEEKYLTKMQVLIAKSGMQSVSRIVDVTNYLMLLTGQPLHAFDKDKFVAVGKTENPVILVRLAKEGEKLVLLDGKEISCNENDILITSNDIPVALAGAMGGLNTEIDENTKNVLIESASFSLYNLRKTQMAHGIFSEAITRFTKGVPASGTYNVLAEAVREIDAEAVDLNDAWPGYHGGNVVKITTTEINNLLGTNYDKDTIIRTLENVGFNIELSTGPAVAASPTVLASRLRAAGDPPAPSPVDVLTITSPVWRTDIHIKEDIIEEVGRLLGYDNIQPTLPLHQTASKNEMFELKREIRNRLASYGANEVLTYSFVSEKLLEKVGQDKKNSYKIVNSISPELQYVRQSILPSLLEKTYLNEKLPVEKFAIFEMNKVYRKEWGMNDEGVPVEKNSLGFIVAERKGTGTAFYKAKKYAVKIFEDFNIKAEFLPIKGKTAEGKPFEPKRTAEIFVNDEYVGVVGEFKNSVRNEFKLAEYLAGFEIDLDLVLKYKSNEKKLRFGAKRTEDLTVTTDKSYAEMLKEVQQKYPEADIRPLSIYQAEGMKEKNISFRIEF